MKSGLLTALILTVVLCAAQITPTHRTQKFQWGQGQPQELDTALADYNNIGAGDRAALLHALAHEFKDYPTPPSPRERAERTRVKFVDLNGDAIPEVIAQPIGNICGAANCPLYVFEKTGTNYRVILEKGAAQTVSIKKTRTNGYLDLIVGMHGSATEQGLFVYQFRRGRYCRTNCFNASFTYVDKNGEVHELEEARITACKK